jgi:hypothetical protein
MGSYGHKVINYVTAYCSSYSDELRAGRPGSILGRSKRPFSTASKPALGPASHPVSTADSLPGVKTAGA